LYDTIKSQLVQLFANANFTWGVCGGLAIDFFVDKHTRDHKDIDLFSYYEDRNNIINFMLQNGWRVFEACGGGIQHELTEPNSEDIRLSLYCMQASNNDYSFIQCSTKDLEIFRYRKDALTIKYLEELYRSDTNMGYMVHDEKIQTKLDYIEFLFSDHSQKMLRYVDNAEAEIVWDNAILNRDGILYMCPEMVLLYKTGIVDRLKKSQDKNYHIYKSECRSDFASALCLMNEVQRKWLKAALISTYPDAKEYIIKLGD
jgi:hypothetical protein